MISDEKHVVLGYVKTETADSLLNMGLFVKRIDLPLDILNQQVCEACGGYLSVGPVKLSSKGNVVCGRPNCRRFIKGESMNSLYNIVASACLYRCTNHYTGCGAFLPFNEVRDHEKICPWAKCYECPFCYYQGMGCQELVSHFGSKHPTYMPTEDVLRKILSYEGLGNHVDTILRMPVLELRNFITRVPKICLPVCQNCDSKITRRQNMYFCAKHHMACQNCCKKKCTKCDDFQPWTKNSVLDKILFDCEWTGCLERKSFFKYLWHKQTCGWRIYECPCSNCEYSGFLDDLKKHWHLSPFLEEKNWVQISSGECAYWLPPLYREIIYVTFDVDEGTGVVTLNNERTVLPVSFRVKLGYVSESVRTTEACSPVLLQKCDNVKYFKIEPIKGKLIQNITLEAFR